MINKFMLAALKALSYDNIDLVKNYKVDRIVNNIAHPSIKLFYRIADKKTVVNGREVEVRIFDPKKKTNDTVIVYLHGGGWVSGNINSYTKTCGTLSDYIGSVIMSVNYSLAPEFKFPDGLNDCYMVTRDIVKKLGSENVVLAGDSAGGNLAAAISLMARDLGEFEIKRQILIYPATYNDHSEASGFPSVIENGTDYLLTSKKIREYMALYAKNEDSYHNPYFAPLLAKDFTKQPETLVITAEFDPLRDEGEEYARRLQESGNKVTVYRMKNALHGFFTLPFRFSHVKKSYALINTFLNGEKNIEK